MSLLEHSLKLFGFLSIDDVNEVNMKRAFKAAILRSHPDKGGDENDVEKLLNSYVYLSETLQRISGGRTTLQNIVSPDELLGQRANELINRIFEEFDNEAFNRAFEENHLRTPDDLQGYKEWLISRQDDTNITGEGRDISIQAPSFSDKELNNVFVQSAKAGKPEPNALILHPDQMAFNSGNFNGLSLVREAGGIFTSGSDATPEYTDVYSAFTTDNTICDKVLAFNEDSVRTLDELIKERENVRNEEIKPTDDDLVKISEWEKKKFEKEKQHLESIKQHFGGEYTGSVLRWQADDRSNGFIHSVK